jgi:hypothetical protein
MTWSSDTKDLPILDATVLGDLEEELADSGLMCRFATDYAALWQPRLGRLAVAVEDQDRDAALDAAISVKVSAAMIGGLRLARIAETLEHAIRRDILDDGHMMRALAEAGRATVKEIELRYSLVGG